MDVFLFWVIHCAPSPGPRKFRGELHSKSSSGTDFVFRITLWTRMKLEPKQLFFRSFTCNLEDLGFNDTEKSSVLVVLSVPWPSLRKLSMKHWLWQKNRVVGVGRYSAVAIPTIRPHRRGAGSWSYWFSFFATWWGHMVGATWWMLIWWHWKWPDPAICHCQEHFGTDWAPLSLILWQWKIDFHRWHPQVESIGTIPRAGFWGLAAGDFYLHGSWVDLPRGFVWK